MSSKFPEINANAKKVLQKRYYWKNPDGSFIESTPEELFERVAIFISRAELKFGTPEKSQEMHDRAYEMMRSLRWVPNTPTLANSGRDRGQLAACYVLPIHDSMEGIMDALKNQALVQKSGGGTGFNFGNIRERGALVRSTGHNAAGPIPIIKMMNYMMSEFITQGGIRNGANMGVLPDDHPDIEEFITFKHADGSCASFNVSVAATDKFMNAVVNDLDWNLKSRADGRPVKTIKARQLFNHLVQSAWSTGDPGLLFIDAANRANPTPHVGYLSATNPCGEQWLLPNEACTLGHHNLSMYVKADVVSPNWEDKFDWKKYEEDIYWGVRFLDNVIELNHYATPEIEKMHRHTNRKIGLGVMGFADMLIMLGIPYASEKARMVAEKIASFHRKHADMASFKLAKERGSFGSFEGSEVQKEGWSAMRNACRTTVAPTGTTAMIAGCSTSIEPVFGLLLRREQAGMIMYESHPLFESWLNSLSESKRNSVCEYYFTHNSLMGCLDVPEDIQQLFVQANDIHYKDHVLMQAVWQKYIDNSISKTINLPNSASQDDVRHAYILAWQNGCKGITVYRDGCRSHQALSTQKKADTQPNEVPAAAEVAPIEENIVANYSDAGGQLCPECNQNTLEMGGGCESCKSCGFSVCHIS